jgi:hypothetical protein
VLGVTFIALYRQLRLQTSAAAVEQIGRMHADWTTELMARSRLAILEALQDGVDPADVPADAASLIANFWEQVGYLVREGHVSRALVYEYLANDVQIWWALTRPGTEWLRSLYRSPGIGEHFEWLGREVHSMALERSDALDTSDPAFLKRVLPNLIQSNRGTIQRAEEGRAVTYRPLPSGKRAQGAGRSRLPSS